MNASDNSQTFLMTNMMPQIPDNNRYTWSCLEIYFKQLILEHLAVELNFLI
ncbi:MAG: DNA/RNA non-specific endonuclease [Rhizonema sp. NSF051]|nr:DNA/RNA non-specific endonuclease [Rhizonema sp. NSF051]